jgi:hypothetical protein
MCRHRPPPGWPCRHPGLFARCQRAGCQGRFGTDVHRWPAAAPVHHHRAAQALPSHRLDGDHRRRPPLPPAQSICSTGTRHSCRLMPPWAYSAACNEARHARRVGHLNILAPVPPKGQRGAVRLSFNTAQRPQRVSAWCLANSDLRQPAGHQQPAVVGDDAHAPPARIAQLCTRSTTWPAGHVHVARQTHAMLVAVVVQVARFGPGAPCGSPVSCLSSGCTPLLGQQLAEVVARKRLAVRSDTGLELGVLRRAGDHVPPRASTRPCRRPSPKACWSSGPRGWYCPATAAAEAATATS